MWECGSSGVLGFSAGCRQQLDYLASEVWAYLSDRPVKGLEKCLFTHDFRETTGIYIKRNLGLYYSKSGAGTSGLGTT